MSESIQLFVPGRLCLFGEHSDWAGLHRVFNASIAPGAAIVTGIEQGIYANAVKSEKFVMRNTSEELKEIWKDFEADMNTESLRNIAAKNEYFSYVAGVASYLNEHHNVGGIEITITKMTLPVKSGLSSSAAICVLVARAFNLLYELNLNTTGEMAAAYRGERKTSSRCGRLDQACAFGTSPVLMTFDGEDINVKRLVVKEPLHWVIANLKAQKDTIKILSDLNKCYPFAETETEKNLHDALGADNQKIIDKAVCFIKEGDAKALGALMTEAQNLFDTKVAPISIEQLKAPKLHQFLNDDKVKALTYGGKGVGSQGDGTVQFLAKDSQTQKDLVNYLSKELEAYSFTIPKRHQVRKAVIPVAGFGTRLYPATRMMRKEFIPLIDKDNLLKPVILILLEELYNSGIEEICLITGSEEEVELYKKVLLQPLSHEHYAKLDKEAKKYEEKINKISKRLKFCIQKEKLGFGHAVYQSNDFSNDEPVLLLLGDTVYYSNTEKSCAVQLIEAYERVNKPIVSICEVSISETANFGIISGNWTDDPNLLKVTHFLEKPAPEYVKKNLPNYYSVFGQYIITPQIYKELYKNIKNENTSNGEYQLTDVLASMIDTGLYAYKTDGKMFDIGNVEAYKKAVNGNFN
ncbi:MAG: sugar phosphate nucleotidyltransferase [Treponema sp.]|nr:sugar phosphate nucleotidyltransferase [Treponema sp.]